MASVEDHDRPSGAEPASSGRRRRSVHGVLGGGAVADLLLWRNRNASLLAAAGATAAWFLFERGGYSLLSVITNAVLLLIVILFLWAKSASLLNRPLPPLPNLEVPDEVFQKVADKARVRINRVLGIGHALAIRRDRRVFLEVIIVLWLVSYVGSLFNFLTFVYIGFLLCLTVPALYNKYQDHIDEKLGVAHNTVLRQYDILSDTTESTKEKKTH